MAPRPWRRVAATLAALLCMAVPPTATTAAATTSVRVAVPDIAGALYPQQAQGRVVRFAAPSASLTPFYAPPLAPDDALPPCDASAAVLCLAVVWRSQYQHDPLVLVAFEAKLAIQSRTFDGAASTTALLPVVEGAEANDGDGTDATQSPRTLWQFHVAPTSAGDANATIDVLFRLRQQSQLRGARDQLLLHVVARREDSAATSAAVETYVVYGNQRVRHRVVHEGAPVARGSGRDPGREPRQVRVEVDVTRDASRADVVLQDAFPLVPVVRQPGGPTSAWRMVDDTCRRCTARLLGCESPNDVETGACSFETSMAEVPLCLRTTQGLSAAWYRDKLTSSSIGDVYALTGRIWTCLKSIFARESTDFRVPSKQSLSWSATSALSCLAARQCPFGPLDGVLPDTTSPPAVLQLATPVPFTFYLEWPESETLSGIFDVKFGGGTDFDPTFAATAEEISDTSVTAEVERVLLAVLSGLDFVRVDATRSTVNTHTRVNIEVWNLPHQYFHINFVATSSGAMFLVQPTNQDGAVMLRVATFNRTQVAFETECDQCASELSACREDDACRLLVLPCVERELMAVNATSVAVDPEYGTFVVNMLPALQTKCFAGVAVSSWNPIRRALVCLSDHECELGSASDANADEPTLLRLTNGSQVIAAPLDATQDGAAVVQLLILYNGATYPFHASVEKLGMFVRLFVLGNAADVFVDAQPYAPNANWIQLRLTYANTLLSGNPSFDGSEEVNVIEDIAPRGLVEVDTVDALSAAGLQAVIRSFMNTAAESADLVAATNSRWVLAPECRACSASFYGCSEAEVEQKTCVFDNAPSALAQCIRQALPRADMVVLLNQSTSPNNMRPSRVVTADVTRCTQTATALAGGTLADRVNSTRALSCFTELRCPFGPVDLVRSDRMLQLASSSFVQSLRIPAENFHLDLIVSMGKFAVTQVTITDEDGDSLSSVLSGKLAPFGIVVQGQSSYVPSEWTLTITYSNTVTSDFDIRVAASSVPSPHYINQASLRPTARLVVGPRDTSKVYPRADTEPPTETPPEPTTTAPPPPEPTTTAPPPPEPTTTVPPPPEPTTTVPPPPEPTTTAPPPPEPTTTAPPPPEPTTETPTP